MHKCPRRGCNAQVPDHLFACRGDWYDLSAETRRWIWRTAEKRLIDRDRLRAVKQARLEWTALDQKGG